MMCKKTLVILILLTQVSCEPTLDEAKSFIEKYKYEVLAPGDDLIFVGNQMKVLREMSQECSEVKGICGFKFTETVNVLDILNVQKFEIPIIEVEGYSHYASGIKIVSRFKESCYHHTESINKYGLLNTWSEKRDNTIEIRYLSGTDEMNERFISAFKRIAEIANEHHEDEDKF